MTNVNPLSMNEIEEFLKEGGAVALNPQAEQVTAEDVLHAICFKAIEEPKQFNADVVKDMVTTLGFAELWEAASEQVLMLVAQAAADLPDVLEDPEPDDELGEEEATDPAVSSDAQQE